jgi:hypothetical protein
MMSAAFLFMDEDEPLSIGLDGGLVDFECRLFQYGGFLCGCNDGLFTYWGAETIQMQRTAVWTQRATAALSCFGSIAILVNIFAKNKDGNNAKRGVYYQLMIGLSICDVLSSIAWGLGPLPVKSDIFPALGIDPDLVPERETAEFYGSHGNDATCTAQGFLLHLGFTSILYNVALSYFFKLSVVNGWRDCHFTPFYRALILGVPAIIGTGVALAAIPFILPTAIGCTIGSSYDEGGWAKVIGLFYLPYGPAFILMPLNTLYIYLKVKNQSRKGNRWRLSTVVSQRQLALSSEAGFNSAANEGSSALRQVSNALRRRQRTSTAEQPASQMEKLVFWQSCWYVAAFFASYAIFPVFFAVDGWSVKSYWYYILLSFLTPMQGFFNACVYFRKRISVSAARFRRGVRGGVRARVSKSRPEVGVAGESDQDLSSRIEPKPSTTLWREDHPSGTSHEENLLSSQPIEMLNSERLGKEESLHTDTISGARVVDGHQEEEKAEELADSDERRSH